MFNITRGNNEKQDKYNKNLDFFYFLTPYAKKKTGIVEIFFANLEKNNHVFIFLLYLIN